MGERQTGSLGLDLRLNQPSRGPGFQRDALPLRLVIPGPLGTPDWHVAAGHNHTQAKKHRGPPTDSPDLRRFKQELIAKQVKHREDQGKKASLGLSKAELKPLEADSRFELRADVAPFFDKMWKKLEEAYAQRPAAAPSDKIGIASTYRSAKKDAIAWEGAFTGYYWDTLDDRLATGDEFGPQALQKIFDFMNAKKAPPGFSGHTHGIAADLTTTENGHEWKVDSHRPNQLGWQKTFLYQWLVQHAAEYHFFQLKSETWHWEFHADDKAAKFACWPGDVKADKRPVPHR